MTGAIELFTAGLVLGASQCVIFCAPMLALYVAGTREDWREGLKATLIFSFSRLFAYVLLGLVAGFSGMFLANFLSGLLRRCKVPIYLLRKWSKRH